MHVVAIEQEEKLLKGGDSSANIEESDADYLSGHETKNRNQIFAQCYGFL